MEIWKQTSLFAYEDDLTLENILSGLKTLGEPTPFNLIKKGIDKFSRKGDLVLDPCCGNRAAGLVALEMGRQAVLCDHNKLTVQTVESLFSSFDAQILELWREMEAKLSEPAEEGESDFDRFKAAHIPNIPAFTRVRRKKFQSVQQLFHPADLEILHKMYVQITRVKEEKYQKIFLVIFTKILNDSSQLLRSKNGRMFYLPQVYKRKNPVEIFQHRLERFLKYHDIIHHEIMQLNTPAVHLSPVYNMGFLSPESVDYTLLYLPPVHFSKQAENYLAELITGEVTDYADELVIELDYRGRYRLAEDLDRLLLEMERVLKENAYMTVIFSGHYVLLSTLIRTAQGEGWQLVQGEVEMVKGGQSEEYPVMSLTLQRKKQNTVLGALNKMKVETLYDTEEAILRKIDQYLAEHLTASTEEIQRYLIENYLHDCLIDKPLEDLLMENYLWSGKYWLKPTAEQRLELFMRRKIVLQKRFNEFICEMTYGFLREEENYLSYSDLLSRFFSLKPRMIFHTPYFRLLMEQCENRGVKLHTLVKEYLEARKRDQFETYEKVLRRILKADRSFLEVVQGEGLGLSEWSNDSFFKIYLEIFEKAKRQNEVNLQKQMARKALEFLPLVTYLEERKKDRLKEYLMRSEGL